MENKEKLIVQAIKTGISPEEFRGLLRATKQLSEHFFDVYKQFSDIYDQEMNDSKEDTQC